MILQALTRHYEDLLALGEIQRPGWGLAKVSYGLQIDQNGQILALLPLKVAREQGKKTVWAPRSMEVPMPSKHTVNIAPSFLCDNAGYLLGMDGKGKPERTQRCFEASKALHLSLLEASNEPAARAICAFFANWDPLQGREHPILLPYEEDLLSGANLVFWYGTQSVVDIAPIRQIWQAHYDQKGEGAQMPCLVTGKRGTVARIHPAIKMIQGGQPSGMALVSFNAPAFCSYGKEQSLNAPVSEYAAFAYTTALNHLLTDRAHVQVLGDMTIVCWAEGGERVYQDFGMASMYGTYGSEEPISNADLRAALSALARGESVDWQEQRLDPQTHFYILALSPNASRLSVRFFLQDTFGNIIRHLQEHHARLEIVRPAYDQMETLSLWRLLAETVNPNAREKAASPQMAGDVLRSILTGGRYPATLLNGVMLRIRAEREVTRGRAAILKAYYLRNAHQGCPEEVLQVQLNEASNYLPYVLGRLFSVLEAIQHAANPGINATIRDKYFNSAAAMPASIFPLLLNLAQKHLRKLDTGMRVYYDRQLCELTARIQQTYPTRLTLAEQGAFQLGYYHQTQKRYTKKEDVQNA